MADILARLDAAFPLLRFCAKREPTCFFSCDCVEEMKKKGDNYLQVLVLWRSRVYAVPPYEIADNINAEDSMSQNLTHSQTYPAPRVETRPLLRNVYLLMTLGLLVTAAMSYITVNAEPLRDLLRYPLVVWGVFIVQLILVGALSVAIFRLSTGAAAAIFLVYAASVGFTLSGMVLYYDLGTLTTAFVATAALFAAMSIVGLTTSVDLTKMGAYLFIGLIGLLFAMLLNIFLRSSTFDLVISLVGVVLFTALTAYDTQKIAQMASNPEIQADGSGLMGKLSVLGALKLYLDFLNLFLFLVRILGRSN
jgi:FtsH-binding integral membrane protein